MLAGAILVMRKKIGNGHDGKSLWQLKIIWTICIFDFILIPINFIIGSWRGYEFFYLARIVMWGECLYQIGRMVKQRYRPMYSSILAILFISWMVFRINSTWQDSSLSPYIFQFLLDFG